MASLEFKPNLNDLPEDILLEIASYLPPNTIIDLMNAHEYFNDVFCQINNFWKKYLIYSKKYYECECNAQSRLPAIEDIIREISENTVAENYGYFKLQKCHLETWASGRIGTFDSIQPQDLSIRLFIELSHVAEMVDDSCQHWLFFSIGEYIQVWNITGEPQRQDHKYIGSYSGIKLIPQGRVLVKDCSFRGNDGLLAVYQFEEPLYKLQLQYKFVYYMNEPLRLNEEPQKKYHFEFRFILVEHLFIGYDYTFNPLQECLLHVWNLIEGTKLEKIDLSRCHEVNTKFVNFVKSHCQQESDFSRNCQLNLHPGQFPYVIVVLRYVTQTINLSQVNIFNVNTRRFTHFIDEMQSDVLACSMYSNRVSLEQSSIRTTPPFSQIVIYSLPVQPTQVGVFDEPVHAKWLRSFDCFDFNRRPNRNIMFKKSKVIIKNKNEVLVVRLDHHELCTWRVVFEESLKLAILGFLEPNLLLMYNLQQEPCKTTVTVFDVTSGREVISWENVNTTPPDRFHSYFQNLEYPSNIVLNIGQELRVYHF